MPSHSIVDLDGITEGLTALGEPTLASLGLCHYTPPGFVQHCLENLHVFHDLPWYLTIMSGMYFIKASDEVKCIVYFELHLSRCCISDVAGM